eukprot:365083-Chlamydomonas_euryale.AAC.12
MHRHVQHGTRERTHWHVQHGTNERMCRHVRHGMHEHTHRHVQRWGPGKAKRGEATLYCRWASKPRHCPGTSVHDERSHQCGCLNHVR